MEDLDMFLSPTRGAPAVTTNVCQTDPKYHFKEILKAFSYVSIQREHYQGISVGKNLWSTEWGKGIADFEQHWELLVSWYLLGPETIIAAWRKLISFTFYVLVKELAGVFHKARHAANFLEFVCPQLQRLVEMCVG